MLNVSDAVDSNFQLSHENSSPLPFLSNKKEQDIEKAKEVFINIPNDDDEKNSGKTTYRIRKTPYGKKTGIQELQKSKLTPIEECKDNFLEKNEGVSKDDKGKVLTVPREEDQDQQHPKTVFIAKANREHQALDISTLPIFNSNDIHIIEVLGEGSFGSVMRAFHKKEMKYIAIKYYKDTADMQDIEQEDSMMRSIEQIQNSNEGQRKFLKYYGLFKSFQEGKTLLILVMESGEVDMKKVIGMRKEASKFYSLANALYIMQSLTKDFKILEENGIASRDVKSENVILVEDIEIFCYKIADFGIGCVLEKNQKDCETSVCTGCSKNYAAPEVKKICNDEYTKDRYNPFKADVYSLGITFLEIIGIKPKDFKEKKDHVFYELIQKMLKANPEERPSFADLFHELEKLEFKIGCERPENEKVFINMIKEKENLNANEKLEKNFKTYKAYKDLTHYLKAEEALKVCEEIFKSNELIFKSSVMEMNLNKEKAVIARTQTYRAKSFQYDKKYQFLSLKLFGEKSEEFADSLRSLAQDSALDSNEFMEEGYLQKALSIILQIHGPEHEKTANSFNDLALFYSKIEKYEIAENFFKKTLHIYNEVLNLENENVVKCYYDLACLYSETSQEGLAEKYLLKALEISLKIFGEAHEKTARIYKGLGYQYVKEGRLIQGRNFIKKS